MKRYSQDEVIQAMRAEAAKTSMRALAIRIGLPPGYLNNVDKGRKPVSEKLAAGLGFRREKVTRLVFFKVA